MVAGALPFLLLAAAAPASEPLDEQRNVLATVQMFFAALGKRDEAAVLSLVVPEGRITAHGPKLRTQAWADWAGQLRGMKQKPEERMHAPSVRVSGSLATVWTDYSFFRDGKFSHCGVDLFDLAKVEGRWRIVNLSFTIKNEGCLRR